MWWDAWKKRSRRRNESAMIAATERVTGTVQACPHPNEFDCRRIERELAGRARYRYVAPSVHQVHNGYRIESPCCSRNVDKEGGVIDIAQLEYVAGHSVWRLYRKDHQSGQWQPYAVFKSLMEILDLLKWDPLRTFWP